MIKHRKIRFKGGSVDALLFGLAGKSLIVLRGLKGYIMCGYLNLKTAEKFRDAAVKITGVSTIEDALRADVAACTSAARKLGIAKGEKIREVIKKIA